MRRVFKKRGEESEKWDFQTERNQGHTANRKGKINQMKRLANWGIGGPQMLSMALFGAVPRKTLTVRDSCLCVGFSYKIKL